MHIAKVSFQIKLKDSFKSRCVALMFFKSPPQMCLLLAQLSSLWISTLSGKPRELLLLKMERLTSKIKVEGKITGFIFHIHQP